MLEFRSKRSKHNCRLGTTFPHPDQSSPRKASNSHPRVAAGNPPCAPFSVCLTACDLCESYTPALPRFPPVLKMRVATATAVVLGLSLLALATAQHAQCDECWGKTSGPCRHNMDWSCHAYMVGAGDNVCPPGTTQCGPIDCVVSEWSAWTKCDASCGGGNQERSRTVTTIPSHGGAKCPVLEESQACNTHKCGA